MNLLETKTGDKVLISDVDVSEMSTNLLNRLRLFGIRQNAFLRIIHVNSSGCLVNITVNEVALGKEIAEKISVEVR